MSKLLDFLALVAASFIANLFWCSHVFEQFWIAAVLALLLSVALATVFVQFSEREDKKPYSVDKFARLLALRGNNYVLELFASALSQTYDASMKYISVNNIPVFSCFKFGDANSNDIAAIFRVAEQEKLNEIVILVRSVDRSAQTLAQSLPVRIRFVRAAKLFAICKKHGVLPPLPFKPAGVRIPLKTLANTVFARRNVKYYLLSSASLAFLSFVTPLKIYYVCFASLCALLALLSVILGKNKNEAPSIW